MELFEIFGEIVMKLFLFGLVLFFSLRLHGEEIPKDSCRQLISVIDDSLHRYLVEARPRDFKRLLSQKGKLTSCAKEAHHGFFEHFRNKFVAVQSVSLKLLWMLGTLEAKNSSDRPVRVREELLAFVIEWFKILDELELKHLILKALFSKQSKFSHQEKTTCPTVSEGRENDGRFHKYSDGNNVFFFRLMKSDKKEDIQLNLVPLAEPLFYDTEALMTPVFDEKTKFLKRVLDPRLYKMIEENPKHNAFYPKNQFEIFKFLFENHAKTSDLSQTIDSYIDRTKTIQFKESQTAFFLFSVSVQVIQNLTLLERLGLEYPIQRTPNANSKTDALLLKLSDLYKKIYNKELTCSKRDDTTQKDSPRLCLSEKTSKKLYTRAVTYLKAYKYVLEFPENATEKEIMRLGKLFTDNKLMETLETVLEDLYNPLRDFRLSASMSLGTKEESFKKETFLGRLSRSVATINLINHLENFAISNYNYSTLTFRISPSSHAIFVSIIDYESVDYCLKLEIHEDDVFKTSEALAAFFLVQESMKSSPTPSFQWVQNKNLFFAKKKKGFKDEEKRRDFEDWERDLQEKVSHAFWKQCRSAEENSEDFTDLIDLDSHENQRSSAFWKQVEAYKGGWSKHVDPLEYAVAFSKHLGTAPEFPSLHDVGRDGRFLSSLEDVDVILHLQNNTSTNTSSSGIQVLLVDQTLMKDFHLDHSECPDDITTTVSLYPEEIKTLMRQNRIHKGLRIGQRHAVYLFEGLKKTKRQDYSLMLISKRPPAIKTVRTILTNFSESFEIDEDDMEKLPVAFPDRNAYIYQVIGPITIDPQEKNVKILTLRKKNLKIFLQTYEDMRIQGIIPTPIVNEIIHKFNMTMFNDVAEEENHRPIVAQSILYSLDLQEKKESAASSQASLGEGRHCYLKKNQWQSYDSSDSFCLIPMHRESGLYCQINRNQKYDLYSRNKKIFENEHQRVVRSITKLDDPDLFKLTDPYRREFNILMKDKNIFPGYTQMSRCIQSMEALADSENQHRLICIEDKAQQSYIAVPVLDPVRKIKSFSFEEGMSEEQKQEVFNECIQYLSTAEMK